MLQPVLLVQEPRHVLWAEDFVFAGNLFDGFCGFCRRWNPLGQVVVGLSIVEKFDHGVTVVVARSPADFFLLAMLGEQLQAAQPIINWAGIDFLDGVPKSIAHRRSRSSKSRMW